MRRYEMTLLEVIKTFKIIDLAEDSIGYNYLDLIDFRIFFPWIDEIGC